MRWTAAIALGIACYLAFLLLYLPAQQVVGWISDPASAQGLMLEGPSGTLWSGTADRVSYQRKPLGRLKWSFKPSRLLLGKIAYDIELQETGQQLEAIFLAGLGDSYRLEDIDALLLARQLPEWLQLRGVRIDGKIRATQLDLSFTQDRLIAAEGSLQWLDGALNSPLNLDVGDLQADLSTDSDSGDIQAQIRDIKGAIGVQAEVRLKTDGNFQLQGTLKPGEKADPGLTGALQAIGRRQPDGSIQLKYAGRI
ncbi:MAG: type II secretion system protein N [Candidatus Thiodiazotropha sp.]